MANARPGCRRSASTATRTCRSGEPGSGRWSSGRTGSGPREPTLPCAASFEPIGQGLHLAPKLLRFGESPHELAQRLSAVLLPAEVVGENLLLALARVARQHRQIDRIDNLFVAALRLG